jgi:hypothetical protein
LKKSDCPIYVLSQSKMVNANTPKIDCFDGRSKLKPILSREREMRLHPFRAARFSLDAGTLMPSRA